MAIPILWRTKKERYSLQGEVCPECERVVFPARRLCPYCGCEAETYNTHVNTHKVEAKEKEYDYSFLLPQPAELIAAGDD
jgi:uncharacterized OB-fold protein